MVKGWGMPKSSPKPNPVPETAQSRLAAQRAKVAGLRDTADAANKAHQVAQQELCAMVDAIAQARRDAAAQVIARHAEILLPMTEHVFPSCSDDPERRAQTWAQEPNPIAGDTLCVRCMLLHFVDHPDDGHLLADVEVDLIATMKDR